MSWSHHNTNSRDSASFLTVICWIILLTAPRTTAAGGNVTDLVETLLKSPAQGTAQLGQTVTVSCNVTKPDEVIMVRLRKLPLTGSGSGGGGNSQEVFASSGGKKQRLHSPWDKRPDVAFNASALSIRFNMSHSDEGYFRCDVVTLDGELTGNAAQLLTAQAPAQPNLTFVGAAASAAASNDTAASRLEIVQGDSVTANCSSNVGKPAGKLELTFSTADGTTQAIAGVRNATWTGPIAVGSQTVTIFRSAVATLKIQETHQGGTFVCRLTPDPLAVAAAAGGNGSEPLVTRSPPVEALFQVRNIRLEPFRENFFHGDSLLCSAEGRPEPSIRWSRIQGAANLPVNGSRLLMPAGSSPGYYSYTCAATNTVRGRAQQLQESIGFRLHNRTAAPAADDAARPDSVATRMKAWVGRHHRGLTIGLACAASVAGLALAALLAVCLCSGSGYSRLGGGGASGRVRDRMRYYGELGDASASGDFCSDDEDDEDYAMRDGDGANRPLNKAENGGSSWTGTQV